jgi:hypothetical protein
MASDNNEPEDSTFREDDGEGAGPTTQNDNTTNDLRDKIKSKMEVAKFFSGFLSILFALSIKDLKSMTEQGEITILFPFVWLGVVLIFGSLAFSVATLFAYDRLLMPTLLWEDAPVSAAKARETLKARMAMAWRYLFLPGVVCFFAGGIMLLVGIFWENLTQSGIAWLITSLVAFLLAIVLPVGVYFLVRTPFRFNVDHQTIREWRWLKNLPQHALKEVLSPVGDSPPSHTDRTSERSTYLRGEHDA